VFNQMVLRLILQKDCAIAPNNSQELRAALPRQKTGDAAAASRYTLGAQSTPPESGAGQPGPAAQCSRRALSQSLKSSL
jgi:hypothetical protein